MAPYAAMCNEWGCIQLHSTGVPLIDVDQGMYKRRLIVVAQDDLHNSPVPGFCAVSVPLTFTYAVEPHQSWFQSIRDLGF